MKKYIKLILVTFLFFGSPVGVKAANGGNEVEPTAAIYVCAGSNTSTTLLQEKVATVYKPFGIWVIPGGSIEVSEEHVFGVSNSSTFTLIPELIETGFENSYSTSYSINQIVPNLTGERAEFVGVTIHNLYKVKKLVEVSDGYCEITVNGNYKVYRGTGYDFRP